MAAKKKKPPVQKKSLADAKKDMSKKSTSSQLFAFFQEEVSETELVQKANKDETNEHKDIKVLNTIKENKETRKTDCEKKERAEQVESSKPKEDFKLQKEDAISDMIAEAESSANDQLEEVFEELAFDEPVAKEDTIDEVSALETEEDSETVNTQDEAEEEVKEVEVEEATFEVEEEAAEKTEPKGAEAKSAVSPKEISEKEVVRSELRQEKKEEPRPAPKLEPKSESRSEPKIIQEVKSIPKPEVKFERPKSVTIIDSSDEDEDDVPTSILGGEKKEFPYFVSAKTKEKFVLKEDSLVIGRKKADIIIKDSYISRKHLRFTKVANKYFIEDLGAANGTYVNGQRIPIHTMVEIKNGNKVRLADYELIFKE